MRVWLIQTGEKLPLTENVRLMRTGYLANALLHKGHEVVWWSSAFDHYEKKWVSECDADIQLAKNYLIKLIAGKGYKKNISVARFYDHAVVAKKFTKQAELMPTPDVIVCALPDYKLAFEAMRFAKKNNIPFIVDLRDRWPWDFIPLVPKMVQPFLKLLLWRDFKKASAVIKNADGLATMMGGWLGWANKVLARAENAKDRVFYIGANQPAIMSKDVRAHIKELVDIVSDKWVILFIGALNTRCWPKDAIEVAKLLRQLHPEVSDKVAFVLAGDGDFMPDLKSISREVANVYLPGYVNNAEISLLLKHSNVGLVTANSEFDALPNKLFTYLSGGLPIVSNVAGELKQLLKDEQVGIYYQNVNEMASAIVNLVANEEMYLRLEANAKEVFSERFDASKIYADYAEYVEGFAKPNF